MQFICFNTGYKWALGKAFSRRIKWIVFYTYNNKCEMIVVMVEGAFVSFLKNKGKAFRNFRKNEKQSNKIII